MKTLFRLSVMVMLTVACNKSEEPFIKPVEGGTPQTPVATDEDNPPAEGSDTGNAQGNLDDITTGFESLSALYGYQGAQIAITRNGKLIYLESFGKADIESNIGVDETSLFRIASISKPITLLAISKLVAENKLDLDATVFGPNSILGTEYGTPPYEAGEENITVSHLIEHRAGFTDEPIDIMFDDISLTQNDLIGKVLDERSLVYSPGEKYEYSNFGYSLLGRIIEKVTEQPYEEYVKDAILVPMGISDMNIGGNTKEEAFENEVSYYSNWMSPYELNVSRMDSHGGWISSAKSMALLAVHTDVNTSVVDFLPPDAGVSYLRFGTWSHDGALPGTTAVMNVGHPISYVVLLNKGEANFTATIQNIREFMNSKISNRTDWPTENLFDTQ
ncbi:serine hydrolase domain-containing protein [Maribacter halichondriae]|uniref:serine hydrolase domain-containing protein n=1 Tax=Maribacter halichondriae TaxID=2980554 RepID=UPI002359A00A|nr:serine hydrolase domain-containing protein [Maribacter sp. Hal144]